MGSMRLKGLLIIIITSIIISGILVPRTWAGPAILDEPIFTDVTPAAFSIVWTVDEPATCTAQVYRDVQGQNPVTCTVEAESPTQAEDLGVMKVLVYDLPSDTKTFYVRTRSISKANGQITDYPTGTLPEVTLETKYNFLVVNDKILQYLICDDETPIQGAILIAQVAGGSYPISNFSKSSGRAIIYMGDFYSAANRQTLPLNGGEALTLTWLTGKYGTAQTTQSVPPNTGGSESIAAETREVYISCEVLENPYIAGISPTIVKSGDQLTITGDKFGSTKGTSQVLFGTTAATSYPEWSDTQIQVYVPSIYPDTCGSVQVKVTVGAQESNTKTITIDNERPAISIQNPPDGGDICSSLQNVTISGTATDQCASIAKVEVKIDTNPWQTATGTATWTCTWDISLASLGTHTISARAIDQFNHISTIVTRSVDIIPCDANVVYVDQAAAGAETGTSWEDAFTTIQEGIDWAAAQAIKEIWVAQGTYNENIVLSEGVSLFGGFNGTETSLYQRNHQSHITTIDGRQQGITVFGAHNALIDGFSITNGNSDWGGGIYCPADADLSVYNNHIHHNKATVSGGGIYLGNQSNIEIIGNAIQHNEALYGGGIFADTTRSCQIKENTITENTAIYKDANQTEGGLGAGMYFSDSNAQVSENTIQDNIAEFKGGGIYIWSGDVSISNNDILGNTATWGGGIFDSASSTIRNNLIHSNQADQGGGGIFIENGATTNVIGNLIENNSANSGGGIFADQDSAPLIESNRMIDNEARTEAGIGGGGAIYLNPVSSARIFRNLILNNNAEWGGGILVWGGSDIRIENNITAKNTVINNGGAIYFDGGTSCLLVNNTFYKNTSGGDGSCFSVWDANTVVDVMNCIIEPAADTLQLPILLDTVPPMFSVTYTDTYGWDEPGVGNINQDPLLIDPDAGNFGLSIDSPCIDAGNPDQQYNDIDGSRNDMGAFGGEDSICLEGFIAFIRATGQKIGNAVRVSQVTIGIDKTAQTKSPAPPPPSYTVRIRLVDPDSSDTYYGKDIRACGATEEIWVIQVEINDEVADSSLSGYYPKLNWDTQALSITGTFSLWTGASGMASTQIVADMSMIDHYQIKPEDGEYFYIQYTNTTTSVMDLPAGWSMISLPVVPQDATLSALFPGAAVMYRFERGFGYVRVKAGEKLQVGDGYWILINEGLRCVLTGQPIHSYSKTINSDGWEMIGGCSSGARPTTDSCDIGVIYRYVKGKGYQRVLGTEAMEPCGGFWILLNEIVDQCEITIESIGF